LRGSPRFIGLTVHQNDGAVADFFAQVVAYGPPKPRTAVKDFKVYPWRQLEMAVLKVLNWDRNPKRRYHATGSAAGMAHQEPSMGRTDEPEEDDDEEDDDHNKSNIAT
jgi:hypothetical protein